MIFRYIRDETRSPPAINSGHGSPAIPRDRQWEGRGEIPPRDPIMQHKSKKLLTIIIAQPN